MCDMCVTSNFEVWTEFGHLLEPAFSIEKPFFFCCHSAYLLLWVQSEHPSAVVDFLTFLRLWGPIFNSALTLCEKIALKLKVFVFLFRGLLLWPYPFLKISVCSGHISMMTLRVPQLRYDNYLHFYMSFNWNMQMRTEKGNWKTDYFTLFKHHFFYCNRPISIKNDGLDRKWGPKNNFDPYRPFSAPYRVKKGSKSALSRRSAFAQI